MARNAKSGAAKPRAAQVKPPRAAPAAVLAPPSAVALERQVLEPRIAEQAIPGLAAPGEQRREITLALHALRKSLDLLDGTNWPDDTDYHAL